MKNTSQIIKSRNELRECVKLIDQELKRCKEEVEYIESKPLNYESKLNCLKTHYLNQIKGINFCLNEDSNIELKGITIGKFDGNKNKVGYEINFTKYFYKYKPLRSSEEIARDLLELDKESENLLKQILN